LAFPYRKYRGPVVCGSMVQREQRFSTKVQPVLYGFRGVNGCAATRAKALSRDSPQNFPHPFGKYPVSDGNLGTYRHEEVG